MLPAHAAELLEDERVVLGCDARAVVAHLDVDPPVLRERLDLDLAAGRRVLDGVVEQVREHLTQPLAVAADERERPVDVRADPHLVLTALGSGRRLLDELADVDVRERVAEAARLDPRRVEDVGDELGEPLRLVLDQPEERLALLGRELAPALVQRPRRADDRGHRAPQLVRDERDEVRAERREPPELLDGRALGLVGADVLDGAPEEAAEEGDELDLVLGERVGLGADEGDHPHALRPDEQRRGEAAAQPQLEELRLFRVLLVAHVLAVDDPSARR